MADLLTWTTLTASVLALAAPAAGYLLKRRVERRRERLEAYGKLWGIVERILHNSPRPGIMMSHIGPRPVLYRARVHRQRGPGNFGVKASSYRTDATVLAWEFSDGTVNYGTGGEPQHDLELDAFAKDVESRFQHLRKWYLSG